MPPKKKVQGTSKASKKVFNTSKANEPRLFEIKTRPLPLPPVQKCPDDLLLILFELYLSENPLHIRNLMLVCKQWYNFAISTPRLWTHIPFIIPHFYGKNAKHNFYLSTLAFIRICLKRSSSSLLHVNADFSQLIRRETWREQMGGNPYDDFSDSSGSDESEGSISISGSRHLSFEEAQEAFNMVTGKNYSVMKRWGSLRLSLPGGDEELVDDVWALLAGPAPNLIRLEVPCLFGEFGPFFPVLRNLSSLKYLSVQSGVDDKTFQAEGAAFKSLLTAPIQHLVVNIDRECREWPTLCRLTSIRSLELSRDRKYTWGDTTNPILPKLTLPHLQSITFDGEYANLRSTELEFPLLKQVCFRPYDSNSLLELPVLQPESVKWNPHPYARKWEASAIETLLKQMLLQYQSADSLEIPAYAENATRKVIGELKEDQSWISALRVVRVVSRDGDHTVFEVSSA